eukprot:CAMPEP_0172695160 /NCGR_PEP_ID=MMETSP1074-20121228/27173_1 /TAXON_ID=2916 /ORGANISM="Ceratium fusus, Strain PA161109" /LENGTH=157 /DNA_ID=CAMNT_0013515751 /DNA_START=171 /DNA_END=641 /DNA_ORIENTATION=-
MLVKPFVHFVKMFQAAIWCLSEVKVLKQAPDSMVKRILPFGAALNVGRGFLHGLFATPKHIGFIKLLIPRSDFCMARVLLQDCLLFRQPLHSTASLDHASIVAVRSFRRFLIVINVLISLVVFDLQAPRNHVPHLRVHHWPPPSRRAAAAAATAAAA